MRLFICITGHEYLYDSRIRRMGSVSSSSSHNHTPVETDEVDTILKYNIIDTTATNMISFHNNMTKQYFDDLILSLRALPIVTDFTFVIDSKELNPSTEKLKLLDRFTRTEIESKHAKSGRFLIFSTNLISVTPEELRVSRNLADKYYHVVVKFIKPTEKDFYDVAYVAGETSMLATGNRIVTDLVLLPRDYIETKVPIFITQTNQAAVKSEAPESNFYFVGLLAKSLSSLMEHFYTVMMRPRICVAYNLKELSKKEIVYFKVIAEFVMKKQGKNYHINGNIHVIFADSINKNGTIQFSNSTLSLNNKTGSFVWKDNSKIEPSTIFDGATIGTYVLSSRDFASEIFANLPAVSWSSVQAYDLAIFNITADQVKILIMLINNKSELDRKVMLILNFDLHENAKTKLKNSMAKLFLQTVGYHLIVHNIFGFTFTKNENVWKNVPFSVVAGKLEDYPKCDVVLHSLPTKMEIHARVAAIKEIPILGTKFQSSDVRLIRKPFISIPEEEMNDNIQIYSIFNPSEALLRYMERYLIYRRKTDYVFLINSSSPIDLNTFSACKVIQLPTINVFYNTEVNLVKNDTNSVKIDIINKLIISDKLGKKYDLSVEFNKHPPKYTHKLSLVFQQLKKDFHGTPVGMKVYQLSKKEAGILKVKDEMNERAGDKYGRYRIILRPQDYDDLKMCRKFLNAQLRKAWYFDTFLVYITNEMKIPTNTTNDPQKSKLTRAIGSYTVEAFIPEDTLTTFSAQGVIACAPPNMAKFIDIHLVESVSKFMGNDDVMYVALELDEDDCVHMSVCWEPFLSINSYDIFENAPPNMTTIKQTVRAQTPYDQFNVFQQRTDPAMLFCRGHFHEIVRALNGLNSKDFIKKKLCAVIQDIDTGVVFDNFLDLLAKHFGKRINWEKQKLFKGDLEGLQSTYFISNDSAVFSRGFMVFMRFNVSIEQYMVDMAKIKQATAAIELSSLTAYKLHDSEIFPIKKDIMITLSLRRTELQFSLRAASTLFPAAAGITVLTLTDNKEVINLVALVHSDTENSHETFVVPLQTDLSIPNVLTVDNHAIFGSKRYDYTLLKKTKDYFHIQVYDRQTKYYFTFGVWKEMNTFDGNNSDILTDKNDSNKPMDFLINHDSGIKYGLTWKVFQNDRVGVAQNYFTLQNLERKDYTIFNDFFVHVNSAIVFINGFLAHEFQAFKDKVSTQHAGKVMYIVVTTDVDDKAKRCAPVEFCTIMNKRMSPRGILMSVPWELPMESAILQVDDYVYSTDKIHQLDGLTSNKRRGYMYPSPETKNEFHYRFTEDDKISISKTVGQKPSLCGFYLDNDGMFKEYQTTSVLKKGDTKTLKFFEIEYNVTVYSETQ